jgi:hypothetical protein
MKRMMWMVAAATLGLAATAYAQDKPCMADAARLCPDVEPGGGAQIECLKSHKADLSPGCKKKVMQMKVKGMEHKQLEQQHQQMPPPSP